VSFSIGIGLPRFPMGNKTYLGRGVAAFCGKKDIKVHLERKLH